MCVKVKGHRAEGGRCQEGVANHTDHLYKPSYNFILSGAKISDHFWTDPTEINSEMFRFAQHDSAVYEMSSNQLVAKATCPPYSISPFVIANGDSMPDKCAA